MEACRRPQVPTPARSEFRSEMAPKSTDVGEKLRFLHLSSGLRLAVRSLAGRAQCARDRHERIPRRTGRQKRRCPSNAGLCESQFGPNPGRPRSTPDSNLTAVPMLCPRPSMRRTRAHPHASRAYPQPALSSTRFGLGSTTFRLSSSRFGLGSARFGLGSMSWSPAQPQLRPEKNFRPTPTSASRTTPLHGYVRRIGHTMSRLGSIV